jgi:hypothetical protein
MFRELFAKRTSGSAEPHGTECKAPPAEPLNERESPPIAQAAQSNEPGLSVAESSASCCTRVEGIEAETDDPMIGPQDGSETLSDVRDAAVTDERPGHERASEAEEEWAPQALDPPLRPRSPSGKGRRLVKPDAAQRVPFTPEQRLLILDTWKRSGMAAGDFASLVGLSRHTLYL